MRVILSLFCIYFFFSCEIPQKKSKTIISIIEEEKQEKILIPTIDTILIGKNKIYETPYYRFNSKKKGPVILIEAGIHGNEIAGHLAMDSLLKNIHQVDSGILILFPRMNRPACVANKRFLNIDLNLVFPGDTTKNDYEHSLANEIFKMIGKEKIEYVITLHESLYLHNPKIRKTYGQTFVYGIDSLPSYFNEWMEKVNNKTEIDPHTGKSEQFYPYYFPIPTSSTETFVETYDLKGGFCIETWRGFRLDRRIEMQYIVMTSFLETLGIQFH